MTSGSSTLLPASGRGSPAAVQQGLLTRPACTEQRKFLQAQMSPALVGAWEASRTPPATCGYLAAGAMLPRFHKIPDISTTFGNTNRAPNSGYGGRDRAT